VDTIESIHLKRMKKIETLFILSGLLLLLISCSSSNSHKIKIGNQTWATKNLSVTVFRNGDAINEARTNEEWVKAASAGKAAWCYYGNKHGNEKEYGKLYNWYAVKDPRGLAPEGWHVPSDAEWDQLITFLGGENNASIKMKSNYGWEDIGNGTNSSGFSALPGGYRNFNGAFGYFITNGYWWSSSEGDSGSAWYRNIYYFNNNVVRDIDKKQVGFSVRCIKD